MSESKNASIAIWVAIIGLIGVVFKAILDNWDKINPPAMPQVQIPASTIDSLKQTPKRIEDAKTKPEDTKPFKHEPARIPEPIIDTRHVTGTVVLENEKPVEGAVVRCTDCLDDKIVKTDKNGHFSLPFRVKNQEEINLLVNDYPYPFTVRVSDPKGYLFHIRR